MINYYVINLSLTQAEVLGTSAKEYFKYKGQE